MPSIRLVAFALALGAAGPAAADARWYDRWRLDLTGFVSYASADVRSVGYGGAIEAKYEATERLALGLRAEGAGLVSQDYEIGDGTTVYSVGQRGVAALIAKADWYFGDSQTRPFVGLGVGRYAIGAGAQSINAGTIVRGAGSFDGWGICPQLGVNLGWLRIAAIYHLLGGEGISAETLAAGDVPTKIGLPKSYLSLELGGTIGGERTR